MMEGNTILSFYGALLPVQSNPEKLAKHNWFTNLNKILQKSHNTHSLAFIFKIITINS